MGENDPPGVPGRRYDALRAVPNLAGDRVATMQWAADALWECLGEQGISWIGFYLAGATGNELILGPCRDSPACSPIGLHGICGRAFQTREPIVVDDVRTLGDGYVACDPRDRSEVVVPLLEPDGSCWGVLDADSREPCAFSRHDVEHLTRLMRDLGLTA